VLVSISHFGTTLTLATCLSTSVKKLQLAGQTLKNSENSDNSEMANEAATADRRGHMY
jgi:hypothetical protein